MSDVEKKQHKSVLLGVLSFAAIIIIVGIIGALTIGNEKDFIQGQVDVSEYRVSSKVPGRILEFRVKEGDFVHAGDTLVNIARNKRPRHVFLDIILVVRNLVSEGIELFIGFGRNAGIISDPQRNIVNRFAAQHLTNAVYIHIAASL